MRVATWGGPSELVMKGQDLENYYFTNAVANLCVVGEREQNQLVFYNLTRDGSPVQRAGVDVEQSGHNDKHPMQQFMCNRQMLIQ